MIVLVEWLVYFPETSYLTWAKFSCCIVSSLQNEAIKMETLSWGSVPITGAGAAGRELIVPGPLFRISYLDPFQCHFP